MRLGCQEVFARSLRLTNGIDPPPGLSTLSLNCLTATSSTALTRVPLASVLLMQIGWVRVSTAATGPHSHCHTAGRLSRNAPAPLKAPLWAQFFARIITGTDN